MSEVWLCRSERNGPQLNLYFKQLADNFHVAGRHHKGFARLSFPVFALVCEQVAGTGFSSNDFHFFLVAGEFKAFLGSAVGFLLHDSSLGAVAERALFPFHYGVL